MYTILLVISFLTTDGNFNLHLERFDTKKSCEIALKQYSQVAEKHPQILKYAAECFPIKDESI